AALTEPGRDNLAYCQAGNGDPAEPPGFRTRGTSKLDANQGNGEPRREMEEEHLSGGGRYEPGKRVGRSGNQRATYAEVGEARQCVGSRGRYEDVERNEQGRRGHSRQRRVDQHRQQVPPTR